MSGIQSVLSKTYGEIDTKHLFDGISDKDIEDNIETAENTIQTNIDRGMLSKNALPPQYAAIPGFKSWFILQHSKKYNGKYKPFKTVAVLEKEFSGTLERNEK